jgi:hypothetical protein
MQSWVEQIWVAQAFRPAVRAETRKRASAPEVLQNSTFTTAAKAAFFQVALFCSTHFFSHFINKARLCFF